MALGVTLNLLAGAALFSPSPVAASPDHQMEMSAREAFAAGRFDDALGMFAKLYAETLHPVYLRNIGRCHQKMRDPQKAIDSFHDYLASHPVPWRSRASIPGKISDRARRQ